jgi:hypothetical protein
MRKFFLRISVTATLLFLGIHSSLSQAIFPEKGISPEVVFVYPWELIVDSSDVLEQTLSMTFPGYERPDSLTYHVYSGTIPELHSRISFGGILDFRYYAGLSYDHIRKHLPGKKISLKVFTPEDAISPFSVVPNRLRITLKSEKDGVWTEYSEGEKWMKIKKSGFYDISFTVPESPVINEHGQLFDPEHITLLNVEYFVMEGSKRHSSLYYSFSDFELEGLDLPLSKVKWQMSVNGHISGRKFLNSFRRNSIFIRPEGKSIKLRYPTEIISSLPQKKVSRGSDLFFSIKCFIPEEFKGGLFSLEVVSKNGKISFRDEQNLKSRDAEGNVFFTVPLDGFLVGEQGTVKSVAEDLDMILRIDMGVSNFSGKMPIVVEPPVLKQGYLIPFDSKWKSRDVQGLGAYPFITEDPSGEIQHVSGINVKKFGSDLYRLDVTARMKGGIDWENPFYRLELVRELPKIKDMNGYEIEMMISPVTDTTHLWQKPYRARIGLLDVNDKVMLGPNISLSEGLPARAALEVSITEPLPKGLVMPGFDPAKVKAVVINLEASPEKTSYRDIKLSCRDLVIRPISSERGGEIRKIDFSRQIRDPESWEFTKLIRSHGGYTLGINYPFPKVDVPRSVMKVPLVYPSVGKKKNDPMHLGFSSELTKKTVIEDFTVFADLGLFVVRSFAFGGLEGVFEWDEKGKDIYFGEGKEELVKAAAKMSVEDLAVYLNKNENSFLSQEKSGKYIGLEEYVLEDLLAFLDIHEIVEKRTGKRLLSILSLYDFKLGEGVDREGPYHEFMVGEHPEVVTDPETKVKAHALVWKVLKELAKDPRFYRYIGAIDVMNEPGNATVLSNKRHFPDLINFVGETIYLAKDAVGPSMPVSVGSRSWPFDLAYWQPIAEGVDILKPHYWESLESYNIDVPGMWPLDMPSDSLWQIFGSSQSGRPTGIGEINPGKNCKDKLLRIEKAGYGFTLLWSYSGHDGYDVKRFLPEVEEYQKGNIEFSALSGMSMKSIEAAFSFVAETKRSFDKIDALGRSSGNSSDMSFRSFVFNRARDIRDEDVKKAVLAISGTMHHKGMDINDENLLFLFQRARALNAPREAF